ncbi:hypothetical protein TNCV_1507221 [Trichonephila clavipes]|nr:hypothetical protein TNCV_1507221 [Trichonephila clavipes]
MAEVIVSIEAINRRKKKESHVFLKEEGQQIYSMETFRTCGMATVLEQVHGKGFGLAGFISGWLRFRRRSSSQAIVAWYKNRRHKRDLIIKFKLGAATDIRLIKTNEADCELAKSNYATSSVATGNHYIVFQYFSRSKRPAKYTKVPKPDSQSIKYTDVGENFAMPATG